MSERLKSVKIPFSAWQALTRMCAATGEPRTRQLAKIIEQAEREMLLTEDELQSVAESQQRGNEE